jgi:hypothetical protein
MKTLSKKPSGTSAKPTLPRLRSIRIFRSMQTKRRAIIERLCRRCARHSRFSRTARLRKVSAFFLTSPPSLGCHLQTPQNLSPRSPTKRPKSCAVLKARCSLGNATASVSRNRPRKSWKGPMRARCSRRVWILPKTLDRLPLVLLKLRATRLRTSRIALAPDCMELSLQ